MVTFEQTFQIALPIEAAWKTLVDGIQNSTTSNVWPHELAEIHTAQIPAKKGSHIIVHYRLGPLKRRAEYRISEFSSPKRLCYQTTTDHPLEGGAEVRLTKSANGTSCTWSGGYRPKNLFGWPSLFWFKAYYERAFFKRLRENLSRLSE